MAININHRTGTVDITGDYKQNGVTIGGGGGLGVSQAWTAPARAIGTQYQNLTGKPIMVSARFESTVAGHVRMRVGAISGALNDIASTLVNLAVGQRDTVQVVVPDTHYYDTIVSTGTFVIDYWQELR